MVFIAIIGLMQFSEIDAEVAFGFVDEDALGDARPGRVVGRRFVFEYRPQLPEAYQRGAEAQETQLCIAGNDDCVDAVGEKEQGIGLDECDDGRTEPAR